MWLDFEKKLAEKFVNYLLVNRFKCEINNMVLFSKPNVLNDPVLLVCAAYYLKRDIFVVEYEDTGETVNKILHKINHEDVNVNKDPKRSNTTFTQEELEQISSSKLPPRLWFVMLPYSKRQGASYTAGFEFNNFEYDSDDEEPLTKLL